MLTHEYGLLIERLDAQIGGVRTFLPSRTPSLREASADMPNLTGGWAFRFQTAPARKLTKSSSTFACSIRATSSSRRPSALWGSINLRRVFLTKDPEALLGSLVDDLAAGRIEIDMIRFSGPDFAEVDDRIMALQLVTHNLTKAALFRADGEIVNAGDALYKKPLLVERGSFRPVTLVADDMLNCARAMFMREEAVKDSEPEVLMEITMTNLLASGQLDLRDFLDRVDMLGAMGRTVLISNYGRLLPTGQLPCALHRSHDRTAARHSRDGRNSGARNTTSDLEGGILEALGRLFKTGVKLYVYPFLNPNGDLVTTQETSRWSRTLFTSTRTCLKTASLSRSRATIQTISPLNRREVLAKIRAGASTGWERMVSPEVGKIIKERQLFGYQLELAS